ncbi:MAG: TolC family protein ['Candidatus Kapabacteria' thiocyanatum]|nr:TolC family protein ['Candidatus Kapabacteria' thiocyanatum]
MRTVFTAIAVLLMLWGQLRDANAQESSILSAYIDEALHANDAVRQREQLLVKAHAAEAEAEGMLYPRADVLASYLRAGGGRTIDMPIGDLLNPAYAALNQLTNSNRFPTLQNMSVQLNPDNFYDAKVRISAPLLNMDVRYNRSIKERLADVASFDVNVVKRELVKDVKTAYFRWMQSQDAVGILQSALVLLDENIRVTRSLLNNGAGNRTALVRATNEAEKIRSELISAEETKANAAAAFNVLLNRPLDAAIVADTMLARTTMQTAEDSGRSIAGDATAAVERREETSALSSSVQALDEARGLAGSHWIPKLSGFVDLGSQGFDFRFGNKTRYYMAGLSFEWNLFSAFSNSQKVRQTEADRAALISQQGVVKNQLALQYYATARSLASARARLASSLSQTDASKRFYDDMQLLYREGKAIYIELLDAQNEFMTARLRESLARMDVFIRTAELERASASYPLH